MGFLEEVGGRGVPGGDGGTWGSCWGWRDVGFLVGVKGLGVLDEGGGTWGSW